MAADSLIAAESGAMSSGAYGNVKPESASAAIDYLNRVEVTITLPRFVGPDKIVVSTGGTGEMAVVTLRMGLHDAKTALYIPSDTSAIMDDLPRRVADFQQIVTHEAKLFDASNKFVKAADNLDGARFDAHATDPGSDARAAIEAKLPGLIDAWEQAGRTWWELEQRHYQLLDDFRHAYLGVAPTSASAARRVELARRIQEQTIESVEPPAPAGHPAAAAPAPEASGSSPSERRARLAAQEYRELRSQAARRRAPQSGADLLAARSDLATVVVTVGPETLSFDPATVADSTDNRPIRLVRGDAASFATQTPQRLREHSALVGGGASFDEPTRQRLRAHFATTQRPIFAPEPGATPRWDQHDLLAVWPSGAPARWLPLTESTGNADWTTTGVGRLALRQPAGDTLTDRVAWIEQWSSVPPVRANRRTPTRPTRLVQHFRLPHQPDTSGPLDAVRAGLAGVEGWTLHQDDAGNLVVSSPELPYPAGSPRSEYLDLALVLASLRAQDAQPAGPAEIRVTLTDEDTEDTVVRLLEGHQDTLHRLGTPAGDLYNPTSPTTPDHHFGTRDGQRFVGLRHLTATFDLGALQAWLSLAPALVETAGRQSPVPRPQPLGQVYRSGLPVTAITGRASITALLPPNAPARPQLAALWEVTAFQPPPVPGIQPTGRIIWVGEPGTGRTPVRTGQPWNGYARVLADTAPTRPFIVLAPLADWTGGVRDNVPELDTSLAQRQALSQLLTAMPAVAALPDAAGPLVLALHPGQTEQFRGPATVLRPARIDCAFTVTQQADTGLHSGAGWELATGTAVIPLSGNTLTLDMLRNILNGLLSVPSA